MKPTFLKLLGVVAACGAMACLVPACSSKQSLTLRGASQFDASHVHTRTLRKFEELVKQYYGKPIKFELYLNSELGLEKDFFAYMSQGISVDYALVSPSHMSTFSKAAPLMDMPFLFRDTAHWNKVLDGDALKPIADEVAAKADVMLVGYAGGGTRNLIVNKPVTNLAELRGLACADVYDRIFAGDVRELELVDTQPRRVGRVLVAVVDRRHVG